ncbi:MerR family transcriptional regulator [Furfurilactobacillus rossiae]|uniref:MerR family transcriptional regulator n=1 Tax=Furfurilactobacillus rossiae DSM 15814 TaxID=1114972 RepID=A0A0R1R963_9LACO|nr:MerR family transcriptional regulator [Furfurilactobacillus rossiae]KRL53494.1 MerR family transcriptional regulator [Furfurilactobacillus rossiae DSM 15814]QFR67629.1 MerR family transcriptional regulator [Furfurilactobacillus rossiae]QLE60589.1 transcriptional regulator MerR [Furfurilactobacillus rossiae]
MSYSISDVAEIMGTSPSTLRYYDKKGLLPFVDRDSAGRRAFKDNDFNFLKVIECMKKCGLTISQIRHFIDMCMDGDTTLEQRYDFLDVEERSLMTKIEALQEQLDFIRYKKWYYKTSLEKGTENIHLLSDGTVDPQTQAQYNRALSECGDIHQLINYQK